MTCCPMQTQMAESKLSDPGIGLRDNGRTVLTYADLNRAANRVARVSCPGRSPSRTM